MLKNIDRWFVSYLKQRLNLLRPATNRSTKTHLLFTICDHYEPFWNKVGHHTAYSRVKKWVDDYQAVAHKHKDLAGNHPQHCFFYPQEEYQKDLLDLISEICRNGFGEVEIHLHHDNDTSENLRSTLLDFKKTLAEEHGLLSKDRITKEVRYGFIHGNWALDNSRPDGKWCGVNDEITILQETGCYADFTMPSAPSDTQTKTINSIYYAVDDPYRPKSHDTGKPAIAGSANNDGLLCLQGPLCFDFWSKKWGIIPRIENGRLAGNTTVGKERIKLWADCNIHIGNRPDIIFVKLYSHGTQERDMEFFFKQGGLDQLFTNLEEFCEEDGRLQLHYVSARQMYNVVKGLEDMPYSNPAELLDCQLALVS